MKIQSLSFYFHGELRKGIFIHIEDETQRHGWAEISPLPQWSRETIQEVVQQLSAKRQKIMQIDWTIHNWVHEMQKLALLPSLSFGLESALLSILDPLSQLSVQVSALLMGSFDAIMDEAQLRLCDGYTSAKLKVGHLSFQEATRAIQALKEQFSLRVDVNRAWHTQESLAFFEQFPLNTFDYVEEPFANPHDLALFPHPLAIDESFPQDLSLQELELLPTLKALVYKPTIQGGLTHCFPLHAWAKTRGIDLVLSSSFETVLGLTHIASMAERLSLKAPVGIGTYHYNI